VSCQGFLLNISDKVPVKGNYRTSWCHFSEYLSPVERCPLLYRTFVHPDTFDSCIYRPFSKNFQVKGYLFLITTSYSVFQVFFLACNLDNNRFFVKFYRLYLLSLYNHVNRLNYISTVELFFFLIWNRTGV